MKEFMSEDFLLNSESARRLYHDAAAGLPIIDYHNHLPPQDVAGNRQFANLFEAWLEGDHYKWRAMRSAGVPERFCTGDASAEDKFDAWARTVPLTPGNPLYHWTHLELRRYFGIYDLLSPSSAHDIWKKTENMLLEPTHTTRGLLKSRNVETVCTTDDPADDLVHHRAHRAAGSPDVRMFPAFRPDNVHKLSNLENWQRYMRRLGESAGAVITGWDSLLEVLKGRHGFFHDNGCRVSDHGVEFVPGVEWTPESVDSTIKKALNGTAPSTEQILALRSAVMESCGRLDARAGWAMQIHMGALRNVSPVRMATLGPDTGFDVIGDFPQAGGLARHLGRLAWDDQLPKTILYCINPGDNDVIGTMIGAFQGEIPGKIQFGSGWWFNDQKDGMIRQITSLANLGLLSCFVGMTTDSRSFLSFPRHEYFRRVLCNLVGGWVEDGELPGEWDLLNTMIEGICYGNARRYFDFDMAV
jgi:glucuronate isomerase